MTLGQLGFTFRGRHRTKPVRLWSAGAARVILNEQHAREQPRTWPRWASTSPTRRGGRAGRRAEGAEGPPPDVRRRARARGRRRPGRDRDLLCAVPPAARPPGWRSSSAADAGRRADHRGGSRQSRPALAELRRGGAVLHQRARAGRRRDHRDRRSPRSGPQPGDEDRRRQDPVATQRRPGGSATPDCRSTSPSAAPTSSPWLGRPETAAWNSCPSRTTTTTISPPASAWPTQCGAAAVAGPALRPGRGR